MAVKATDQPKELILWTKGVAYDTYSALQQAGYLKTCENISLEVEGKQTLRKSFINVNTTAIGAIHSIKKWRSLLVVGDGTNLRANSGSSDFTNIYSSLAGGTLYLRPYKDFLTGVNGTNFVLLDLNKNLYPGQIANPLTGPTLADSGGGTGTIGHYMGYVSYFITWPNGHTYETGLSPASADLNEAGNNTITWTNIPTCPVTTALYGTAPTIYRKLYRGPGTGGTTLTDIYYVGTITDNTTPGYSDPFTATILGSHLACYVDNYLPPYNTKYIEWHYGRAYMVHSILNHRLYWSEVAGGDTADENEALMPLAIQDENWDDLRVAGLEFADPQGLFSWGAHLYIPFKNTWIRKQGNDPDTWVYRKTYARNGIGAPYTVDYSSSPGGLIGVTNPEYSEPGIAIFGGQTSEIITSPKLDYIFNTDMNLDYVHMCRGKIVGRNYHLLYPSGSATKPDTYLCVDLRRIPEIRVAEWKDLNGRCIDSDSQGRKFYIGASTGYAKTQGTGEAINILLETHDLIGGIPQLFNEQKTWTELKYSLKGTVTLQVYVDNTLLTWPDDTTSLTLTGTDETIQFKKFPLNTHGYKIRLKITGTALTTFEIYSPWQLLFD